MEAKYEGRNFFFSGHDPELKGTRLDWLGECKMFQVHKSLTGF